MIDYHLHTSLCNHARGLIDEYVAHAIRIGLKEICFLDHLTLSELGKANSMSITEVGLYFQTIRLIAEKYKPEISIKVGLEVDYHPQYIALIEDLTGTYAFDVIGSSVHFVEGKNIVSRKTASLMSPQSFDHVYSAYLKTLREMLDFHYYDVICHIDVIKKFGWTPSQSVEKEIDEILFIIHRKSLTVEINTSGFNHPVNEMYPGLTILQKCLELEIPITLSSDAHSPQEVGRHFEPTLDRLKAMGYHELSTFSQRRRHPLNLE